jgi:nicotinate-nucleotide pyrophosphorylase (carboxylating)
MYKKALTELQLIPEYVDELIMRTLKEDIGPGDISTDNIIPEDKIVSAYIQSKEDGIVAGLEIAARVFTLLNPHVEYVVHFGDGAKISKDDILMELKGTYRAILTGERTALNFLQRLSGIASVTNKYVEVVKQYGTKILDTRKTAPGLRVLDKFAVQAGGGTNHRIGLYDMVMIKDNHIKVAGGIKPAVAKIRTTLGSKYKIEVETTNLNEVREALEAEVDIIMLDNMDDKTMKEVIEFIGRKALTEASGNMSLERVKAVAECGVNYISVGALTHSIKALDIGLYING